jgi:hypothetical protein
MRIKDNEVSNGCVGCSCSLRVSRLIPLFVLLVALQFCSLPACMVIILMILLL